MQFSMLVFSIIFVYRYEYYFSLRSGPAIFRANINANIISVDAVLMRHHVSRYYYVKYDDKKGGLLLTCV